MCHILFARNQLLRFSAAINDRLYVE